MRIIGAYRLAPQETNLITLDTGTYWRETVLEVLKGRAIPISLWILIGSIIGGLLLLALIIFVLWKVFFNVTCHLTKVLSKYTVYFEENTRMCFGQNINLYLIFSSAGLLHTQTERRG